ncbi:MAG: hypothetical protein QXO68_05935, partial [Conexivisphaerales archaeon]
VLGILHKPEGKAVGESYELIRNPRRDLRMISTQGYLFNRAYIETVAYGVLVYQEPTVWAFVHPNLEFLRNRFLHHGHIYDIPDGLTSITCTPRLFVL